MDDKISKFIPTEVQEVLPSVDDSKIDINDLLEVKTELLDIAARWNKFGEALNVKKATLDQIKQECGSDTEECLDKTLQVFLKMNYDTKKYGQPSWKLIVQALAHRGGGNDKDMALKVAGEHSTTKPPTGHTGTASASASTVSPADEAKPQDKAILKERPDMRRLIMVTYRDGGKTKRYRPLQEISLNWEDIANYLEVGKGTIANAKRQLDATGSARVALQAWLGSDVKASWSKLIKAMKTVQALEFSATEFRTALLNIVEDDEDDDD